MASWYVACCVLYFGCFCGEGDDNNERMRLSLLWQVFNDTVGGVAFKCGIPVKNDPFYLQMEEGCPRKAN